MKVHSAIAKAIRDSGVDTMFGLMGDGNLFMIDSFVNAHGGRYVPVSNESQALPMARGYSYATGQVGVGIVTHGPGLTNTMTSLIEGVKARTPLVLIAGDTPIDQKNSTQDIAQHLIAAAAGAGFEQVRAPRTAVEDTACALRRAQVERRPIVLNVPADFAWEEVEYEAVEHATVTQTLPANPAALDRAIGIIASSHRPIVLAGRGAASPQAQQSLIRLAERIGAPVATSLLGKGLFTGVRCNLGLFGTLATEVATEVILESDCIVAFGAGLNKWTTAEQSLLDGKAVVHVDVDPQALGAYARIDAGVVGDVSVVADAIIEWLDMGEIPASGFATDDLSARISAGASPTYRDVSTDETVDVRTALIRINEAVPADRVVVGDIGRHIIQFWSLISPPNPWSFLLSVGFGSIGFGMPNAIGVALGEPTRPVLLVCGDGGFALGGINEFHTAVRQGSDLIVVVCNDGTYGAEHIQFRAREMDAALAQFPMADLAPVAEALGGEGVTVRCADDLDLAEKAIANRTGPLLIDLKIGADDVPPVHRH